MKIGITGAQSVGKTTLLNALRSEEMFKEYTICDEVTRWVRSIGLPINETGNDTTQELIMLKHIYNITMFDNMLTDRTFVDNLVYTRYLHSKQQVSSQIVDKIERAFVKFVPQYDHIFYIKPEFVIVNDGVRSVDKEFQASITKEFEHVINTYDLKVHILTGSVRQRLNQFLEYIDNANN